MEKTLFKYSNAKEYLGLVGSFPRTNYPRVGRFLSFFYRFHLNPLYKKHPELKKYLDFLPFDLCIAVQPKKKLFMCVNFHALPVKTRQIFIARLKKTYEINFEKEKVLIPGINYRKLFRYLRKIGVAIRQYRMDRVALMREVPGDKIDLTMKYYANFYYRTNIQGITSRYNNYVPVQS